MHCQHKSTSPHRQSTAFLPDLLPEAKIIKGLDMTAQELSRALGGREAGDEWWGEGFVVGDEAWIDDYDDGRLQIRCRNWRGLLQRLNTWQCIVRYYRPTLRSYVTTPVSTGYRSDVLFKIGAGLAERGADVDQIFTVLAASEPGKSKYGGRSRALRREVERIIRRSHGH